MRKKLLVGIDIGGTKIQAGLLTSDGKILKKFRLPTEAKRGRETILANIEKSVSEIWSPDVKSIGAGMAGLVDNRQGIFVSGPNFSSSFKNVRLAAWLKRRFGVPAIIDNDAHCFTLGEALFGAGRKLKNVIGITLGTGIGGGIVIDGRLYRGRDNAAGEVGHMTVSGEDRARCGCGRPGHFEALGAGPAQTALFRLLTGRTALPTEIEELAIKDVKKAKKVIEATAMWLGHGLANIVHVLNPDMMIIGGGLSRNRLLWPTMRRTLKQDLIFPLLRSTPVVRSFLGDDANILGAALLTEDSRS